MNEVWKAEKAAAQGSAHIKEEIDKTRFQIEELKRKGEFNQVAELQYGKLPQLEKELKNAQDSEPTNQLRLRRVCCGPRWGLKKSLRLSHE